MRSLLQNDGTAYPLVNTIRSPGSSIDLNCSLPGSRARKALLSSVQVLTNLNIVMPFNSVMESINIMSEQSAASLCRSIKNSLRLRKTLILVLSLW